jgi:hypothetical protein
MKMPELEWDFIVRWDSWKWWLTPDTNLSDIKNLEIIKMIQEWKVKWYKSWDIIDLHGFTSVSNNLDDIFIWKWWETKDTLIVIRWEKWKIRDISDLAMFTNFAKELWKPATKFEWVVLSNSKVAFKGAEIKYIELTDKITWEIYKQKVLEITVDWIR